MGGQIMSGEQQFDRYLQQLPVKSFAVAAGDVIGGLIYVMDKPAGVEEGMVGISIDSPRYRQFVDEQLGMLRNGTHPYAQLQERFNNRFKRNAQFNSLTPHDQIDALLNDKVHLERRLGLSKTDLKNIFLSFGKLHEVKAFARYYENVGTGGLLFKHYKKELGIKKKEHFATQIGKIISDGNSVYMVKQDGIMTLGRTGFGFRRMMKTEIGKKLQIFANPFVVLGTAGLSSLVFAGWGLGFLVKRHIKNKPEDANSGAIVETVSTKIASIRGFTSQNIETIEGTFEDGTPKIATIVGWSSGCRDLSGKLAGGESDKTSVVFACDKNDQPLRVDTQGNILRTNEMDKGKISSYEKILPDGKAVPIKKGEYEKGMMVSEDRIAGLGEALTSCICLGDRDGIGEYGQNKVIKPIDPPHGKYQYQFFGIDFGKAYEGENNYVGTLSDDFSFINPRARVKRFLNVSILYDNPLRDKMKGIYLMAALRNKLSDEQKEAIAKEYDATDKEFADKLRGYPLSLAETYGKAMGVKGRVLPEGDPNRELWLRNGDLWLLKGEENKYRLLAQNAPTERKKRHYSRYADRLGEVYKIARDTDNQVFKVFEKRLMLTPSQIDILEGIEKLTADRVYTHSPDGKVQLNHLRVEREDRVPWQLKNNDDGSFDLICESTKSVDEIKKRLAKLPELNIIIQTKTDQNSIPLTIKKLSQADLAQLHDVLIEDNVAKARNVTTFRTQAMKASFHDRLKKNAELELGQKQAATPMVTQPRSTTRPVSSREIDLRVEPAVTPPSNLETRKKSVGFVFNSTPDSTAPFAQQTMVSQSQINVKSLKKYLDDSKNRKKLDIVDVPKELPTGGLAISFKNPDEANKVDAFVEDSQREGELQYSVIKGLDPQTLDSVMRHVCRLALNTAEPYAEIDISAAPPENREALQHIFEEMLNMAVQENRFTESTKPKIIGKVQEYQSRISSQAPKGA